MASQSCFIPSISCPTIAFNMFTFPRRHSKASLWPMRAEACKAQCSVVRAAQIETFMSSPPEPLESVCSMRSTTRWREVSEPFDFPSWQKFRRRGAVQVAHVHLNAWPSLQLCALVRVFSLLFCDLLLGLLRWSVRVNERCKMPDKVHSTLEEASYSRRVFLGSSFSAIAKKYLQRLLTFAQTLATAHISRNSSTLDNLQQIDGLV